MLKTLLQLLLTLSFVLLSACSQEPPEEQTPTNTPGTTTSQPSPAKPLTYIESGDLPDIREHQTLRLIAPRFDGKESLPRERVSIQSYQQLAEEFTEHLNLEPQWVFVDGLQGLIPALIGGRGDLIVTNMTVTRERQQHVRFANPINQIREVVVTRKDLPIKTRDDIAGLTFVVPKGSAAKKTLDKILSEQPELFSVTTVDTQLGKANLLELIDQGEYQATLIDNDIAEEFLPNFPGLATGVSLSKHRPIAWAVRPNNPRLLEELNQFLISHHIGNQASTIQLRDWPEIKNQGQLRLLTLNNPASYFMWRGELMGFDYDLIEKFAKDNRLRLSVLVKDSIPDLFAALKNGEGDVVAASITPSAMREALGITFTRPYLKVVEQLVSAEHGPKINSLEELNGYAVGVNPNTVFYERFQQLNEQGMDLSIKTYPGVTTENLFQLLKKGEFDFLAADSHLVALEQAHNTGLHVNFALSDSTGLAWGIRPNQPQLKEQLDRFIKNKYRGLFYNVTYNKYFKNQRKIEQYAAQRIQPGDELSPYDDIVQPLATKYNMDWRLIVAQMYQESQFDTKARSFAGARGLMQVLPRTAKQMGYNQLTEPANGIGAGVAYMHWLRDRFPGDLDLQERIYFTLAAYNAGAGHVRDARRLARQMGWDASKWFDNTERAMLLLSKPKYYKNARFGYVRGHEPVAYVRNIRDRYLAYIAGGH